MQAGKHLDGNLAPANNIIYLRQQNVILRMHVCVYMYVICIYVPYLFTVRDLRSPAEIEVYKYNTYVGRGADIHDDYNVGCLSWPLDQRTSPFPVGYI